MRVGLLLLVGLAIATRALAADVPVTYSVEFRAYKSNVAQGDPLTFALYEDSGCTRLLHSQVVNAGPAIRQEKIFVQTVREQAPRPEKEMRLHATLTVPTLADAIYLKVTGPGIVPIDGACQPQAGQAGTEAPSLSVRNGNSIVIGQTSTPTATCGASSCTLSFTRTVGNAVELNCTVTENSMGTTVSCVPVIAGGGQLYVDPGCTQLALEWPTSSTYSPTNLPANPPPTPPYNVGGAPDGKVLYSEAPMSSYSSIQAYFLLGPYCLDFGTHLMITPQVFDPATLNVPPFTVGP
jgi:hypothetical protein